MSPIWNRTNADTTLYGTISISSCNSSTGDTSTYSSITVNYQEKEYDEKFFEKLEQDELKRKIAKLPKYHIHLVLPTQPKQKVKVYYVRNNC